MKQRNSYVKIKRVLDFTLSLIGILVLSPIYLILMLAIKLDSPGPILFKQKRVGIHKTHFNILKFRTMKIDTPKDMPTPLLANPEQYITKVGKFLRKTSLDELPQIINILKGDMSVVGPRPLLVSYLPYYTEEEKLRHTVRPGLTGLAQVSGRNFLDWDNRLKKDVEYVKNLSFWMDVKILFKTVSVVFKKEDVAVDTEFVEGSLAEERKAKKP